MPKPGKIRYVWTPNYWEIRGGKNKKKNMQSGFWRLIWLDGHCWFAAFWVVCRNVCQVRVLLMVMSTNHWMTCRASRRFSCFQVSPAFRPHEKTFIMVKNTLGSSILMKIRSDCVLICWLDVHAVMVAFGNLSMMISLGPPWSSQLNCIASLNIPYITCYINSSLFRDGTSMCAFSKC